MPTGGSSFLYLVRGDLEPTGLPASSFGDSSLFQSAAHRCHHHQHRHSIELFTGERASPLPGCLSWKHIFQLICVALPCTGVGVLLVGREGLLVLRRFLSLGVIFQHTLEYFCNIYKVSILVSESKLS